MMPSYQADRASYLDVRQLLCGAGRLGYMRREKKSAGAVTGAGAARGLRLSCLFVRYMHSVAARPPVLLSCQDVMARSMDSCTRGNHPGLNRRERERGCREVVAADCEYCDCMQGREGCCAFRKVTLRNRTWAGEQSGGVPQGRVRRLHSARQAPTPPPFV